MPGTFPLTRAHLYQTVVGLLCSAAVIAGAESPPPPAADAHPGRYFGFGPMEILKFETGISVPIAADVNHDGLNDLVVVNNRKARIDLLLQKRGFRPEEVGAVEPESEDINDLFGKERTWRFKRVSYPLNVAVTAAVVADLNNDDYLDIAYYGKDGLVLVRQAGGEKTKASRATGERAGPRQPVWETEQKIDIREGLSSDRALAAGDLNGDGLNDLALCATDSVYLILQKPDGTVESPRKYPSSLKRLRQIHISDVNGDGRQDLLLLTATIDEHPLRVRLQTPGGKLGPEVRLRLAAPTAMEVARLGGVRQSYVFSIAQASGRVQIAAVPPQAEGTDAPVYAYPLPATEKAEQRDVVAADVDGDGLLDVVVSDPTRAEFLLYRAHRKSSLTTPERFPGLKDMRKLCAADLDGSGRDTIVAMSFDEKLIALSRLQKGRLSFPETVPITGEPQGMDVAETNGDTKQDVVYVAKEKQEGGGGDAFVLRSVLDVGRSTAREGPFLALKELRDKPADVRAADIDADGRVDVMIIPSYGPILLLRQTEPGVFVEQGKNSANAGLVSRVVPPALSFAPLGPEGATAALVTQKNFARALIFDQKRGWQVVDQYPAVQAKSNLTTGLAARFQLEPKETDTTDAITVVTYDSVYGKLAFLTRQADGTYRPAKEIEVGSVAATKLVAGNFGGTAPVSLLLCGQGKLVRIPVGERASSLRQLVSFEPDIKKGRYGAVAIGDVNSDGCPDIVLCEQVKHHVEILTFNAEAQLVNATTFKVFEEPPELDESGSSGSRRRGSGQPRAATIADVTGDGKNDLIVQVHDRIIVYPQD